MMQEALLPDMLLTVKTWPSCLPSSPGRCFAGSGNEAAQAGETIAPGRPLAGERHAGLHRPVDGKHGPVRRRGELIKQCSVFSFQFSDLNTEN